MLRQRVRERSASDAISRKSQALRQKNKGATPVKVLRPIKLSRKVFPSFVVQSCCAIAVKRCASKLIRKVFQASRFNLGCTIKVPVPRVNRILPQTLCKSVHTCAKRSAPSCAKTYERSRVSTALRIASVHAASVYCRAPSAAVNLPNPPGGIVTKLLASVLCCALFAAMPLPAQAPGLSAIYAQIRAEETNNSKIMWLIHEIADVYGPRVTGTPNLKAADDWAVTTLTSWGLANAHLEPWTFQPPSAATPVPGWENMELLAEAVAPFHGQLMVKPLAWTPSTNGVVTAQVVQLEPPGLAPPTGAGFNFFGGAPPPPEPKWAAPPMPAKEKPAEPKQPTQAELDAYLNSVKDKVRGAIVFVGRHVEVAEDMNPAPMRRPEDEWKARFDAKNPRPFRFPEQPKLPEGQLTRQEVSRQVDQFLVDNGALVRINDAGRAHGIIIAQQNGTYDWTRAVPTLVMRNEDYGRISRTIDDGTAVTLKVNIQNKEYPEGTTAYNAIGEIPGTDKKDEIVMLGGHYDSWHDATGATDNGIGSSMMLEAARILSALHVKPRRTIRVALWSGEEEGLLGSLAYVKQHFGSFENPKPEYAKLDAYFNIDSGTGRPRGAIVFGPADAV